MTKDEALKMALETLEWINRVNAMEYEYQQKARESLNAIYDALAEQETVLPGGGHVPAVPVAVYGYCPECGGAGVMRERRPNGDDKCTNGHKYPSSKALAEQPAQQQEPCQCPECQVTPHASDCAVHNEPAYQKGSCDCGAQQWNAGVPSLYPEPEPGVSIKATYEQPAQQQEPVAWLIWLHGPAGHFDHKQFAELEFERRNKEYPDPDRKLLPLYTTPPQRKPLTDEEISNIWCKVSNTDFVTADTHEFARAIEAAHGIKE